MRIDWPDETSSFKESDRPFVRAAAEDVHRKMLAKERAALNELVKDGRLAGAMSGEEVRVVDPNTGGEKGSKLAKFSLIPAKFLWDLAEHYGKGMKKYAARNWERGYDWALSVDAHDRHWNLWLQGEDYDVCRPDCPSECGEHTGSHHLVAACWHLIALWWFQRHNKGNDTVRQSNT